MMLRCSFCTNQAKSTHITFKPVVCPDESSVRMLDKFGSQNFRVGCRDSVQCLVSFGHAVRTCTLGHQGTMLMVPRLVQESPTKRPPFIVLPKPQKIRVLDRRRCWLGFFVHAREIVVRAKGGWSAVAYDSARERVSPRWTSGERHARGLVRDFV